MRVPPSLCWDEDDDSPLHQEMTMIEEELVKEMLKVETTPFDGEN